MFINQIFDLIKSLIIILRQMHVLNQVSLFTQSLCYTLSTYFDDT